MTDYAIDPTLPSGLPRDGRKTVVTIGTFDGVHQGHWEVLSEIRRRAEAVGGRSVLVTFHPHPLTIVRPEWAPPMLTTPVEKKEIFGRIRSRLRRLPHLYSHARRVHPPPLR